MADSSTGGYLLPTSAAPLDDQALDHYLHDLLMNISGLAANLVFPRWQEHPPNMPAQGVTWMAQGVTERRDDGVAWQDFNGSLYTVSRNQELDCLVSFYGPNASATEALVRDGFSLDQNREAMNQTGLVLVRVGNPRNASMQINERWQKRIDTVITFRRLIARTYAVLPLVSGAAQIETDTGIVENFTVT